MHYHAWCLYLEWAQCTYQHFCLYNNSIQCMCCVETSVWLGSECKSLLCGQNPKGVWNPPVVCTPRYGVRNIPLFFLLMWSLGLAHMRCDFWTTLASLAAVPSCCLFCDIAKLGEYGNKLYETASFDHALAKIVKYLARSWQYPTQCYMKYQDILAG